MLRSFLLSLIRAYQRCISPLKRPCCRFFPTCSEYAHEAVIRFGIVCGLGLALWRLLRCQPFGRSGYDPVPAAPNLDLKEQVTWKIRENGCFSPSRSVR